MVSAKLLPKRAVIRIEVPIEILPGLVEATWATDNMDTRFKVTDPLVFAKELCYALNSEEEDGSTPVRRMFDTAINAAIDYGAEGIEEHEEQKA